MHRLQRLAPFLILCFLIAAPASAQTITADEQYRQALLALIARLEQQIALLEEQLEARLAEAANAQRTEERSYTRFSDSVDIIARYPVDADLEDSILNLEHRTYVRRVLEVLPDAYEARLAEFIVFDGESYFDAFVETLPPEHDEWAYAVNEEVIDDASADYNTELIVHELAHIVGYDEVPGTARPASSNCHAYFRRTGCPLQNSYLGRFAARFWDAAGLERALSYTDEEDPTERAEEHYDDHELDFVTSYAAVSPEEDFAESFMFYMLEPRPKGGEARAKVEFFDAFEEFQNMRSEVRSAR